MTTTTAAGRDLDQHWIDTFTRHHDLISLLLVLIRHTNAGAHPVPLAQVAAALGHTEADTEAMFAKVTTGLAWAGTDLDHGMARFVFTEDHAHPRFRYHIGERVIDANGCAPDIFLISYGLRQPFWAESACPATGAPIRVDFGPDGVTGAQPATTMVAAIDPVTVPQAFTLTDPTLIDTDICLHQPFFASTQAVAGWLAAHPSGEAIPAAEFYTRWREFIARSPAGQYL